VSLVTNAEIAIESEPAIFFYEVLLLLSLANELKVGWQPWRNMVGIPVALELTALSQRIDPGRMPLLCSLINLINLIS
jgi:hypothetical protein